MGDKSPKNKEKKKVKQSDTGKKKEITPASIIAPVSKPTKK